MSTPVSEMPTLISLRSALADDHRRAEREAGFRRRLLNRLLRLGPCHVFERDLYFGDDGRLYRVSKNKRGFRVIRLLRRNKKMAARHEPYMPPPRGSRPGHALTNAADEPYAIACRKDPDKPIRLVRSAWQEIDADWTWTRLPIDFHAPPGSQLNEDDLRQQEQRFRDIAGVLEFILGHWETVTQHISDAWEQQGTARDTQQPPAADVEDLFARLVPTYKGFLREHPPAETCPKFTGLLSLHLNYLAHGRTTAAR